MSYSLRCLRLAPAADRKSSAAALGIPSAGCPGVRTQKDELGKAWNHRPAPAASEAGRDLRQSRRAGPPTLAAPSVTASGKRAARWRIF
jgi:hypothetical protein